MNKENFPQENENKEKEFQKISLEIKEADEVHLKEIIFDEKDKNLVKVYNRAINEICNEKNKLGAFHQVGNGNNPGYHGWEFLGSKPSNAEINVFFEKIHAKAKEIYLDLKDMGWLE
jgi:hypothetical protein